ncbi:MAG: Lrp/AsnC family transcriptional regulator [Desulfurococcales archaeon]|nr:Lrp/AsnC family transcriptional regulator [Desulfurococcales archaeon]
MRLDSIDIELIREMLRDSRQSLKKLAKRLGMPTSSTHDRVKRLARNGVIKRFTLELDCRKIGLDITILTLVKVKGPQILEVESKLRDHPNIVALYDITGEFDMALIAKFRDMREADKFIKSLLKEPGIERTVTSVVLNVVKESYCPETLPKSVEGSQGNEW